MFFFFSKILIKLLGTSCNCLMQSSPTYFLKAEAMFKRICVSSDDFGFYPQMFTFEQKVAEPLASLDGLE